MARIGVVHTSLNSLGGAEKLCIETIFALKEAGHQIDLIVNNKTNWQNVKNLFNVCVDVNKEIVVPPYDSMSNIYSRFLYWFFRDNVAVSYLRKNYDLMITTQPFLPITFTDIMYVNDLMGLHKTLEFHYPKYRQGFWRFYKLPYEAMTRIFVKLFNTLESSPFVLTNSFFTKQVIGTYLNVNSLVVYPPVDVERYLSLSKNMNRKNIVLTISRIELGKGLNLIPYVAKIAKNVRFVIIGSLSSEEYLLYLYRLIRNLGVEDSVKIIPNASHRVKETFLSQAKIYLHSRKYEYFGIAIVEAMSAGLIPVVHKSGAPWIDILNRAQGMYGYAYEDVISCANYINELIEQYPKLDLAQRTVERSKTFSAEIFRNNLCSIVKKFL